MTAGVIAASYAPSGFSELVLARNPLVYWKFDETGADGSTQTAADASGNGRTGTIGGTGFFYRRGRIVRGTTPGETIAYVDNNSRIFAAHASWMDVSALTALVIHRPADISTGYVMAIDDNGSGDTTMMWDVLRINDGTFTTQSRGSSGVVTLSGGAYSVNVPYVIAYTLSAAGEFLYVNGQKVITGAGHAPLVATGMLRVENLSGTGFPAKGEYDEFVMFGSALSDADHLELANAALAQIYWPNTGSLASPQWAAGMGALTGLTRLPTGSSGTAAAPNGGNFLARAATVPSPFTTSAAQTVEFWFTKPSAAVHGALCKIDASGKGIGWGLLLGSTDGDTDGNNLLLLREGLAWHNLGAVSTGNHHLVVTRNGSTFQVYLDGSSFYGPANPGSINEAAASGGIAFGGYLRTRNLPSTVPMDKIALYNSVLSGARVTAHYNGGAGSDSAVAADSPIVLLELDGTPS